MDRLWKKEPNSDIFVDLLPPFPTTLWDEILKVNISSAKHRFLGITMEPTKSNRIATEFRVTGNQKFKNNSWRAAMELYNQSLLFAENDSENVSLAYANRSACFLHMQKYTQCLRDIEMAKENNYPKQLMHKLEEREVQCLEKIKETDNVHDENEPKLSFDPDERFPCMANVLKIETNNKFGRHIVAKCDIDVGQTVLVEEPFVIGFEADDRTLCFTCLKQMKNFIPCHNCVDAMFCDEKCMQTNDIHKIACGAAHQRLTGINLNARSILTALNAFPTVEHLMEFIKKKLVAPKSKLPNNCSDAQTEYVMFLKLKEMKIETEPYQITLQYITYEFLMAIPTISARFDTLKKQRFLMHLIWQHKLISDMNSFYQTLGKDSGKIQVTCNINSRFNHSCIPNVFNDFVGNKQVLITVRPVKKGQQLFVMYNESLWMNSTEVRQEYLKHIFNFTCKCSRCMPKFRPIDCLTMKIDPIYQFIVKQAKTCDHSDEVRLILKEKCVEFMKKYGHLPWSDEIFLVTLNFMNCLHGDYPEYRKIIV